MKTNIEILADVCRYENVSEIELNDDITVEEALEAMQEYGKYCAEQAWREAERNMIRSVRVITFESWWAEFQRKEATK